MAQVTRENPLPIEVRLARAPLAALLIAAAVGLSSSPVAADEPAPRAVEVTPLPPIGAPAASAEAPTDEADETTEASVDADPQPDPDAPPVYDGPLRPKGTLPERPLAKSETWTRSFERGVTWKNGDAKINLSGSRSSVRLGASLGY